MLAYIERTSRRLARVMFYAMASHRQALRDDQGRQNRIEMVGEDLLVIAATALHAELHERTVGRPEVWDLAEEVFCEAGERIEQNLRELVHNRDAAVTIVGKKAFLGTYPFLSDGIIRRGSHDYLLREAGALRPGQDKIRTTV